MKHPMATVLVARAWSALVALAAMAMLFVLVYAANAYLPLAFVFLMVGVVTGVVLAIDHWMGRGCSACPPATRSREHGVLRRGWASSG